MSKHSPEGTPFGLVGTSSLYKREVVADFPIDGIKPGENLAKHFAEKSDGVREFKFATPIDRLDRGTLTISVRDRQGHTTRIERTISVGSPK